MLDTLRFSTNYRTRHRWEVFRFHYFIQRRKLTMGNLTKNISQHELKCKCGNCEVQIQSHELIIQVVQEGCDHFANLLGIERVKLIITSAARCYEYNRLPFEFGGAGSIDESQHPRCNAMDIQLFAGDVQIMPSLVYAYFCTKYPDQFGVGSYKTFTHVDSRSVRARWGLV
ncbi:MAG: hypothetical protein HRU18_16800 [Pseudoalteromonas sp.]|nr:hypothetical protein [Pseudoalteromonas sp.]